MSRIGKQPVKLEQDVTVSIDKDELLVKGPKGELMIKIPAEIMVSQEDGELVVSPKRETKKVNALWGLTRSLIANAVEGVSQGFVKELELVGVGFRAQKKESGLELEVGFSHKVEFVPPPGVLIDLNKGVIRLTGVDKQKVGQAAANIRKVRPPEPYKGKGIRYVGEQVKLKPGKSAKGAGGV